MSRHQIRKQRKGRSYAEGRALRGHGQRPQTREQWHEAVDGAYSLLCLDSARQYGLVTGGPRVNVERCRAVLEQGAAMSIRPAPDAVEKLIVALAQPEQNGGQS